MTLDMVPGKEEVCGGVLNRFSGDPTRNAIAKVTFPSSARQGRIAAECF